MTLNAIIGLITFPPLGLTFLSVKKGVGGPSKYAALVRGELGGQRSN